MSENPFRPPPGLLLALDDPEGSLEELPLRLVRLGVDVLYSADDDEAELLARQEGARLAGLILPSASAEERLEPVLDRLKSHSQVVAERVAILGPRLDPPVVQRLRERGLRWRLWSPFEDRDLRSLGWSLVWNSSDQNVRLDARVPTALPAQVIRRGETRDVLVGDLSLGGAFLETEEAFPAGSSLGLVIRLPNQEVEMAAMVRWVSPPRREEASRAPGFGVEFTNPPPALRAALEEHLASERARFTL